MLRVSGSLDIQKIQPFAGSELMPESSIRYLVFDVESFVDAPLAARLHFPEEEKTFQHPEEAVARWKEELRSQTGKDFIPYTFHLPTAIVLAKVSEDFELLDIAALSEVSLRPAEIAERFWRGWERYGRPTFVTFNGRSFDIPLLELAAFRFGLSIPGWFSPLAKNYDQPRSRYNQSAHIDLQEIFTNFGSTRFNGGLDLAANLIGKPGKIDVFGEMVDTMRQEGRFQEIEDYCRCDVLDTYFVFLRTRVMMGYLSLAEEQKRVESARKWLEERAEDCAAYRHYLESWGCWEDPWNRTVSSELPSAISSPGSIPGGAQNRISQKAVSSEIQGQEQNADSAAHSRQENHFDSPSKGSQTAQAHDAENAESTETAQSVEHTNGTLKKRNSRSKTVSRNAKASKEDKS